MFGEELISAEFVILLEVSEAAKCLRIGTCAYSLKYNQSRERVIT